MSDSPRPAQATLAVTGSTGRLGSRIARRIAGLNMPQRLLVRDPDRAPPLHLAEVVRSEYDEHARRSLEGVDTLLMVSASETVDRVSRHTAFVDAAADAGVGHIVYISFIGAAPNATFTLARDHAATERHIRASGLAFTFLRDNLYADFLPGMVGADGNIRGPAGDGRVAAVAQVDIADAATAILIAPDRHHGTTYELTGPEALSFDDIAAILTAGTGRPVRYHHETVAEAYESRAAYGAPDWQVEAWVTTYTAIAAGEMDRVTDHVEQLTGHPATSLAALVRRTSGTDDT